MAFATTLDAGTTLEAGDEAAELAASVGEASGTGATCGIETAPVPVALGPTGKLLLPMGKGADEGAAIGDEAAGDD